jgi:hypothetical protein
MNEQNLIEQATAIYESKPWVKNKLDTEAKKVAVAQAGVTEVKGRHYVVLINGWGDVLGGYKVVGEGVQEMRRWPTAVEADPRWAELVQDRRRFKTNFSAYANRNSTTRF